MGRELNHFAILSINSDKIYDRDKSPDAKHHTNANFEHQPTSQSE